MTGESVIFAPDLDHSNAQVQNDVVKFADYLQKDLGYQGIRFDFAKGFDARMQDKYWERFGRPWTVAEMWHGDTNVMRDYIGATAGHIAVFDFPLYYILKRCVQSNDFHELAPGHHIAGILGADPVRAVTFIDNHDTSHLPEVGGKFGNDDQVVRGYAFLLTHPGTPTVFWPHIFGAPDHVAKAILRLCKLRGEAGIHSGSRVEVREARYGLYAAVVHGSKKQVAMKLGNEEWHPGQPFHGSLTASGNEFAIWIS
eukprot:gnl/TRDRNA2_/TRDRNA2_177114_c5_seq1.p1 gnl/TRDRNA2_/TRDRNA2_177114_c5~~gnl/TRDRNA2_/TRDRNA2_177114_c5_seq1.p1  ORF type:complete len:267 (+),score=26.21 gnl/TRDRNA2_/TRDRNA2_177114_c5_seq1:39-803(+)